MHHALALLALASLAACSGPKSDDTAPMNETGDSAADSDTDVPRPSIAPAGAQTLAAGSSLDYTLSDLTDGQAYRVTMVVAANITVASDGSGTFIDADDNGAADAGPSEAVTLISAVNGTAITPAKTVPTSEDDPMNPTGVFPVEGAIVITVTGIAAGQVVPVVYENGGISTFLEVDDAGIPVETHAAGGVLTVE